MGFGFGQKECVAQTQFCEVWDAAPSIKDAPPRGVFGTKERLIALQGVDEQTRFRVVEAKPCCRGEV
jgi:hypothetical protein